MDEGQTLGDGQSAPSADNSTVPTSAKRHKTVSAKIRENGIAPSVPKPNLMRDSDVMLTLVGEIFHDDPECCGI
jgi:hypothetical protein